MSVLLAKNWWSLALRGLAAIALGLIVLTMQRITLEALLQLFGVYAVFDGLVALAGALRAAEGHDRWGALLFEGLTGIVIGFSAWAWPDLTGLRVVYLIAAWAFLTGIFEIFAALRLRDHVPGEWMLLLSGIASLGLGVLMMTAPLAGALTIARWVAVYALVFGALLLALGLRLRSSAPWQATWLQRG